MQPWASSRGSSRGRQRRAACVGRAGSLLLALVALAHVCTRVEAVQLVTGIPSLFTTVHGRQHTVVTIHDAASKLARPGRLGVAPGASARTMTDKDGKQYVCYMPAPEGQDGEAEEQEAAALATAEQQQRAAQLGAAKTPFELLERLTGLCLYRQEGLWTYEMCYKKQTRQFRQPVGDNKGEDFSCGVYTGDEAQVEEIKVDSASPSDTRLRYVSHNMTGGAPCALSGSKRTSEVRFSCVRDVRDNVIISVREFPTCNYIFTVSTPFICKHPEFKPPDEHLRVINCVPADAHSSQKPQPKHPQKHQQEHQEHLHREQPHQEQQQQQHQHHKPHPHQADHHQHPQGAGGGSSSSSPASAAGSSPADSAAAKQPHSVGLAQTQEEQASQEAAAVVAAGLPEEAGEQEEEGYADGASPSSPPSGRLGGGQGRSGAPEGGTGAQMDYQDDDDVIKEEEDNSMSAPSPAAYSTDEPASGGAGGDAGAEGDGAAWGGAVGGEEAAFMEAAVEAEPAAIPEAQADAVASMEPTELLADAAEAQGEGEGAHQQQQEEAAAEGQWQEEQQQREEGVQGAHDEL